MLHKREDEVVTRQPQARSSRYAAMAVNIARHGVISLVTRPVSAGCGVHARCSRNTEAVPRYRRRWGGRRGGEGWGR